MKVYVQAKSKKEINEFLAANIKVYGYNYSHFGGAGWYDIEGLQDGDVVAVYAKKDAYGNPIAKSWGAWSVSKKKLI
jgi:hypothetical protein